MEFFMTAQAPGGHWNYCDAGYIMGEFERSQRNPYYLVNAGRFPSENPVVAAKLNNKFPGYGII